MDSQGRLSIEIPYGYFTEHEIDRDVWRVCDVASGKIIASVTCFDLLRYPPWVIQDYINYMIESAEAEDEERFLEEIGVWA